MPTLSRSGLRMSGFLALTSWAGALELLPPTKPGTNPDYPPFVTENNGVYGYPWGAGNYRWPEQLFWDSMPDLRNHHLGEMIRSSDGTLAQGKAAIMSCVAWGYEYGAAIGGDTAKGFADKSKAPGWGEWGRWLSARKDKYFALDWDGNIHYPDAGYVTPMMPLDSADWPEGIPNATFGDFAGVRLGKLANTIHANGIYAADFVVGLYGGNHDFHPRVIDDFERWAGVKVPGTTVKERADFIVANLWSKMNDFKAHRFARFYARLAETIRSSGREPLVGGQILPRAASVRATGNDFRIYLQHLPAKNWFFEVELQADEGRPVEPYWWASAMMGGHASRSPDFPLGAHMDAYQSNFWNAVNGGGNDSLWGVRYMKHAWLSVGWTHVANTDGTVRRAALAFQRAYWDAGGIDSHIVALVRAHAPRHGFGPAIYYSTDLERQSEGTGNPNFTYWLEPKSVAWLNQGVPAGYYISDTALANLREENRPTGWFVYVDNLGKTRLSDAEKARLEAIAPILDVKDIADSCPVSFEGDSLGGYGFIDQNGSVIVVSSNASKRDVEGAIRFAKVENGSYPVRDLLTGDTATLVVSGNKGRLPMTWKTRDTRVFEIPGLREKGKKVSILPKSAPLPKPGVAIFRPDGKRIDILGRPTRQAPDLQWSAPSR
ncbi:MAG: hypothetical protein IPK50_13460 [Fibrobacterota bacterium]|nr:hypothetical protein [Fibrobacterota bacterium]QQS03314.1 MAG: hypothetical protein IPK50_13460 [Fibrobacterota bacterium]